MYRTFYAERDTTIYEKEPKRNTGIDQILELTKIASGSKLNGIIQQSQYNSRILIDFGSEITTLTTAISNGEIPSWNNSNITSASAFLVLRAADASDLMHSYNIKAFPVSESWTNGNGYFASEPIQKYGASWYYRTSDDLEDKWNTGSAHSNDTGIGTTNDTGGGTWVTGSQFEASQSFQNESPDIRIDVTDIVKQWTDGTITNNGFVVKRPYSEEKDGNVYGSLKFFGRESHTIYVPKLEVCWDDVVNTDGASTTQISSETYVPYIKNIRAEYRRSDIARFRVGVRPEFPSRTFATSSFYMTSDRLPNSSSYSILDSVTNEVIIKDEPVWSNSKTKIAYDANGNYFDLRMDNFMPERYYKIMLTCRRTSDTQTFDDFYFKVVN